MAYTTFRIPNTIIHGNDALCHLATLEGKRATIVTGGHSMHRFGFLDETKKQLEKAGMEVQIIDGVEPDPSIKTCVEGGAKMAEFKPDWIVALGGGSPMDAAKIMWVYYEYPGYDFMELVKFNFPKLRTKAKLICIPSTSGTASEITAFSVITDTDNNIKYPLVCPDMVPDIALLDNRIPAKMPPLITAQTGMDVMTHAVEAYVSTAADDYTDPLALHAIQLIFEYLETAYKEPDNMLAREKIHNASTMAGMAFTNASLGIVHSMAHKIGGEFHLTHGEANAILLPYIIQYNKKATSKYAKLEGILGIDNLEEAIWNLNQRLGLTRTIQEGQNTAISEADFQAVIDRMSPRALEDACTLTNPRKPTTEDIKKIYEAAYYGKPVDF
ncbi:iron-containing alcohol dehydrogenase [Veillonella criceti]|uniref:Aldehyde-alcohol dehydrogenase n=1 Tax=Veillonella criceti TaxID=103891 RepID=A0A380NNB4_9FIRM|nr:iron-containing alcohol dehydrogenase [Veillonella criceti]SUP44619.1 Aldehyde-alcohol dehydrogenase [Veillonella criceti]